MRITQVGNPGTTSPAVKHPEIGDITKKLTRAFNEYIGQPLRRPLNTQTLKTVHEKFWNSPVEEREPLCEEVWKSWEDFVKVYRADVQAKPTQIIKPKTKPIVFATEVGLDIDLVLESNGNKLEAKSVSVTSSGSSINVRKTLNNFGIPAELVGIAGEGVRSKAFHKLMQNEGIDLSKLCTSDEDIRMYFCAFAGGKEHWTVSQHPYTSPKNLGNLTSKLFDTCKKQKGEMVAMAVKSPRGAEETYMPDVIKEALLKYDMLVIYDAKLVEVGNDLFKSILEAPPYMIKPNLDEFAKLVGEDSKKLRKDRDVLCHLATELINHYQLGLVMISMDKDGALLTDGKRFATAVPPKVEVTCTVGAGDTGIAGLISRVKERNYALGRLKDSEFQDVLKAFVAAGTATTTKPGTGLASREDFEKIEAGVNAKLI